MLPAPEGACFTVYFGRLNIAFRVRFTKCLYSPLSRSCVLLPSSVSHPEPEQRQGRKKRCGKTTWFSAACKIKGSISPRVHFHRENAQPHLHTVIMTTAINVLSHSHCTQRDDRQAVFLADSSPMDQRSHHQTHTASWSSRAAHPPLRVDQQHPGGVPALAALHPHSPEAKAPGGSTVLDANFRPAGCYLG